MAPTPAGTRLAFARAVESRLQASVLACLGSCRWNAVSSDLFHHPRPAEDDLGGLQLERQTRGGRSRP